MATKVNLNGVDEIDLSTTNGQVVTASLPSPGVVSLTVPNATLETNGTPNGSQSLLNLKAGSNVTLADDGVGDVTISATGNVTSSGGTAGYLPVYTGITSLGDSAVFQSGSNVGIGTASPAGKLHLYGPNQNETATPLFKLTDTNTGQILAIDNASTANAMRIFTGGGTGTQNLELQINSNAYQLVLNQSGNVGVGVLSPGQKLEVDGSIKLTASSGGSVIFQDGTSQSTAASHIALQTNGTSNSSQTLLNLKAGTNVTLSEVAGAVTINSSGGGGSGSANHFVGTSPTPSISAGPALGSSTVSVVGNDAGGTITVTTGASPAAGVVCTVTFSSAYAATPNVVFSAANAVAAATYVAAASVYITATASAFEIQVATNPLQSSATYVWAYNVIG